MNAEPREHTGLSEFPSSETLRQQLDIQWHDHWDIRGQTWKALQMVALLFVGYIGSGLKVNDPLLIRVGGVICMLAACFGMAITIHHRKIQIQKFTYIFNFEEMLGLHHEKLLGDVKPPQPFSLARVFDFRQIASPTFILLMHLAIFLLAAAYVMARW